MDNEIERTDLVTLIDDEGLEHQFAVIDVFPFKQKQYAILVPVIYDAENQAAEPELADDAYIFRIEQDEAGGEEYLVEVGDEAEWLEAAEEWEKRNKSMEETMDEDEE